MATSEIRALEPAARSYEVLDAGPENVFNTFARLAASIGATPIAPICFTDGRRHWLKAKPGLSNAETPCEVSSCTHPLRSNDLSVVPGYVAG